jgi:threonine dehydrogenase-like Zn-dependent dehydrogenase
MKSVRTVVTCEIVTVEYTGKLKPRFKVGDYVRVFAGLQEGHHFTIKDIRFNHDNESFQYYYPLYGWYAESWLVNGNSRQGWHYDSQGYCDNPGRGY